MTRISPKIYLGFLLILLVSGSISVVQSQTGTLPQNPYETAQPREDFGDLIWSDDCDGTGSIDTTKWFHQTRLPNGVSWWNNEIQHYTNRIENSFYDTGYLHIVARKEEFTDQGITKQYTSARLNSKFAFTYGKVEIRAILPFGPGTWPAMWTLGKNITENGGYWQTQGFGTTGWPACGEIDIMEHWGTNQNVVSSAMHTPSSSGNTVNKGGRTVPNVSTEFHVFRMEWTPEKIVFSIDTVIHYTYNPAVKDASTWPYDLDQYLLLNIAIQSAIENTDFTESPMIIDYVRVYEYTGSTRVSLSGTEKAVLYPNPVKNELIIETGEFSGQDVRVSIHGMDGRAIKSYLFTNSAGRVTVGNLDDLAGGLYLVTLETGTSRQTFRVLKE